MKRTASASKTSRPVTARKSRATKPRTVHVVAFRPLPECEGGVGGFDWFPTAAEADARLAEVKGLPEHAEDEVRRFPVEVTATKRDAITAEIDGQLDALMDEAAKADPVTVTPFRWDGETFQTRDACEKAIEKQATRLLCDADCGSVEIDSTDEQEGESVNLAIRVAVLTPEGDAAEKAREDAPAILAALASMVRLYEAKWSDAPAEVAAARAILTKHNAATAKA